MGYRKYGLTKLSGWAGSLATAGGSALGLNQVATAGGMKGFMNAGKKSGMFSAKKPPGLAGLKPAKFAPIKPVSKVGTIQTGSQNYK